MHIDGRNPTGKCGEYFSNNDQWWGQVAEYCLMVAPEISAPCRYWKGNDGYPVDNDSDGLDAAGAVALADALQKEVDSGRTETFAQELASLLPEPYEWMLPRIPRARNYPFSAQNVAAFAAFLRESGGFWIS